MLWMLTIVWILLFGLVFFVTQNILEASSKKLENKLARESNERVYKTFVANLRQFLIETRNNAMSDETRDLVNGHVGNYFKRDMPRDYFEDENISFAMFYNKKGKLIWGKGFYRKNRRFIDLPESLKHLVPHFKKIYIGQVDDYHIVEDFLDYNVATFIEVDKALYYMATNLIYDEHRDREEQGMMIYLRKLDMDYIKDIAEQSNYNVELLRIEEVKKSYPNVYDKFSKGENTVLYHGENDVLSSFKKLLSWNNKLIYALKVDVPREIYIQTHKAASLNLYVVVILSLLATGTVIFIILHLFNQQEKITNSFERFVPQEFLELLDKENILDVQVGNNVEKEISVMFTDIRNFTTVSEKMTAEMNFNFVNAYLMRVAPAIAARNGFIDKYIGDGIMALFHKEHTSPDDAILAALQLLEQLQGFNSHSKREGWPSIYLGIGINTGMLRLGIIGGGRRLEGTAISDAVNTAARIESMTKYYGVQLMISESTLQGLENPDFYHIRFLDEIKMKGKQRAIAVYEVYDADNPQLKDKKDLVKPIYLEAFQLYKEMDYERALTLFMKCLEFLPEDMATQHFIGKCRQEINRQDTRDE